MDKIAKKNNIISLKKKISHIRNSDIVNVVFFLHNEDIIYIGRTSNIDKYILEEQIKYNATHFYSEMVSISEANNYIAELILEFQPIYNTKIPKNTKFISSSFAKSRYFISKCDFRAIYIEFGGYKFEKSLFIKKQIFDDVFCISEPYNEYMPRLHTYIILKKDILNYELDTSKYDYTSYVNEDGSLVKESIIIDCSDAERYKKLEKLIELEYEVIQHLDANRFKALRKKDSDEIILYASERSFERSQNYLNIKSAIQRKCFIEMI